MSRIVFATYMTRYPMGGNLSWAIQHLLGLKQLGCHITIVERANYPNACFDPTTNQVGDDPAAGLKIVRELLARYGLEDHYVFRDVANNDHGLSTAEVQARFKSADLFIDSGNHGAWLDLAHAVPRRVLIDGEPGFTQIRMQLDPSRAQLAEQYTHHFSNGLLLHTDKHNTPKTGQTWLPFVNPVCPERFADVPPPPKGAPWTTIMNWQAHKPLEYNGETYGQKDMSFQLFEPLPTLTRQPIEVAVSGDAPRDRLAALGWRINDAKAVTQSVDHYDNYIRDSMGEFSIAKHVFVKARTGWFSDRSAAYLASGRPVILQDTGFSEVLPTGEGLFAVSTAEQAAAAIDRVCTDYPRHRRAARSIAREHLDAKKGLESLLALALSEKSAPRKP